MEKIDWQEITEGLGEDRWRDDLIVMPRQSRLLLAKLVQENRFLSRDDQQIYYGPDSQAELHDAAKTAYNSLVNPLQTEFIDMFINGDLNVNNGQLFVDESTRKTGINNSAPAFQLDIGIAGNYSSAIRALGGDGGAGTSVAEFSIYNGSRAMAILGDGGVILSNPSGVSKGVGTINIPNAYYVNGLSVIGSRKTGWAPPIGTASRTTFSTSTVTLESLAQRLKALIDDLISHGLIGG